MNYYSNIQHVRQIWNAIDKPNWRVWKVEDADGRVRQNRKSISNEFDLQKFIGESAVKVYHSISQFLEPTAIKGKRKGNPGYEPRILRTELFFDFDSETDLSIAHNDAKKVIEFMEKHWASHFRLDSIIFSGSKGFHLVYQPLQQCTTQVRALIAFTLPELETIDATHIRIIMDEYRVRAALHSIKAKTGNLVCLIPLYEFTHSSTEKIKADYIKRVARVDSPMTTEIRTNTLRDERPTLSSTYFSFISNEVEGKGDSFVTVLKYPKDYNAAHRIRETQIVYNLPTFYAFDEGDMIMYISLKIISRSRLIKIMKSAKAYNLNSFLHFGHAWIRITEEITDDGDIVNCTPKYINKIEAKAEGMFSRCHTDLINMLTNQTLNVRPLTGEPNLIHTAKHTKGD